MRCKSCGSACDKKICECCLFIDNHPEVVRDQQNFAFWISVEIEAMEQAADRNLFRRHDEDLKKGILKQNKKLKK